VAVGAPDRKVICLQADGSGMYSIQSLWTQAHENLDVLTIIYSNRKYAILEMEMANFELGSPNQNARRMMELDDPALDWVALAKGLGVAGGGADTVEEFRSLLQRALGVAGPFLIECRI
jgi:acetolactate synthase-1/2/3 large subunit